MRHIESGVEEDHTRFKSAKMVFLQIAPFKQKPIFPCLVKLNHARGCLNCWDDNAKLRAIPNERRYPAWCVARVKKMDETLSETLHSGHAMLKSSLRTLKICVRVYEDTKIRYFRKVS